MTRHTYPEVCTVLGGHSHALQILLRAIPQLTPNQRKAIITLCQVQVEPIHGTLVERRTRELFEGCFITTSTGEVVPLKALTQQLGFYFRSQILSGLISMLVRNAPIPRDLEPLWEKVRIDGIIKECRAALEVYHPVSLGWPQVLSIDTGALETGFFPNRMHDVDLARSIARSLRGAAMRFANRGPHYPYYGKKTIGKFASRHLQESAMNYLGQEVENTTLGLEFLYSRTGVQVVGHTEMRCAWKYNVLKPRVYYARGPDVYYASRYIQELFNYLIDSLPVTDRFQRFQPIPENIGPNELLAIYDYSSFTSSLHEIRNFTQCLADSFRGIETVVIDSYLGPITIDLGDMLDHFNQICNCDPEFDVSQLAQGRDAEEEELLVHNCGMLGVPGNISSCTLLHGIHLMMVVGAKACKVVGDDAKYKVAEEEADGVDEDLQNIGKYEKQKGCTWTSSMADEDLDKNMWHYVKRPITRLSGREVCGTQMIWPPIAVLLDWTDKLHTTNPPSDRYQFMRRAASMLLTFAQAFTPELVECAEIEIHIANRFIRYCLEKIELEEFTYEGPFGRNHLVFPRGIDGRNFDDAIIEDHWYTIILLPLMVELDSGEICPYDQQESQYTWRFTRSLKMACDMGWASCKARNISYAPFSDNGRRLRLWLSRKFVPLYDIVVFESCPVWLVDIVRSDHSVVSEPPSAEDSMYGSFMI